MSEEREILMKQRRQSILEADKWRCRICEVPIDGSHTSSEDEKDSILLSHLNDTHLGSPSFNQDMRREYMILYFKIIDEKLQGNVKF